MEHRASLHHELPLRFAGFLLACLVGLTAAAAALQLGELTRKKLVLLAAGGGVVVLALLWRRPKQVFLFAWVLLLTYNRNYWLDALVGNHASQGLYWLPSDLFLLAIAGVWAYQRIVLKLPSQPAGQPLWPWFLPFAAVGLLSAVGAGRMDWGLFEMVRIVKFGFICWLLRHNLRPREWQICMAALALAILLQCAYGALQISGRSVSFFGAQGASAAALQELQEEHADEWRRATGTLGHPNLLAPYLMLLFPMFLALSVALRRPGLRLACALVGLAGLLGVAATLSRMAWLLALLQCLGLAVGLTAAGILRAQRAVGILALVGLLAGLAVLPFMQKIQDRLTRDLRASVEFRTRYDAIALKMFAKAPFFGVGLNNFPLLLPEYDPQIEEFIKDSEVVRKGIGIRVIPAVHNLYLLLLAETGLFGLAAFLLCIVGVLRAGRRAIRQGTGPWRAVGVGFIIGTLGALGHQVTEFSLWVDPVFYTFALLVAMINAVPAMQDRAAAPAGVAQGGWQDG